MYNFYTSLPLAEYFLKHGTHVIGTIRDNRKHFPTKLKSPNLDEGAAAFYEHDGLVIAKYKSTGKPKTVHVLITAHTPAMGNTNKNDKEGNIVQKSTCIILYNHNMDGVDMMDQQLDGIEVLRKSYRWYRKIFLRLVMQCALSSHKLYKLKCGKDVFLYHLLDVCTHLFSKVKMCRVCNARGKKTKGGKEVKTTWIYKGCPEEPGLCVEKDCFEVCHTKLDFSQ